MRDLHGNIVFQKTAGEGDIIAVNSNVKPGTYLLRIVDGTKTISKERILIE